MFFTWCSSTRSAWKNIAETFLKEKKDYENAEKWYKIAYELKKDEKYLTEVENYRKSQPIYNIEKEIEQAILKAAFHS